MDGWNVVLCQVCRIVGLKARRELNGQTGTIVRFLTRSARWKVRLAASPSTVLSVRESNLASLPIEEQPPQVGWWLCKCVRSECVCACVRALCVLAVFA